jgi:hypothetical protein
MQQHEACSTALHLRGVWCLPPGCPLPVALRCSTTYYLSQALLQLSRPPTLCTVSTPPRALEQSIRPPGCHHQSVVPTLVQVPLEKRTQAVLKEELRCVASATVSAHVQVQVQVQGIIIHKQRVRGDYVEMPRQGATRPAINTDEAG